jgi:hypothetical protein
MDFEEMRDAAVVSAVCLRDDVVDAVRDFRSRCGLPVRPGETETTGFCRGVAWGLMLVLQEEVPEIEWRVEGGWGVEAVSVTMPDGTPRQDAVGFVDAAAWPGGMVDRDGVWRGHFWVTGRASDGGRVIVDLTADQFGWEDVVVEAADDPRYRSNLEPSRIPGDFTAAEKGWGVRLHYGHGAPPPAAAMRG